jgi:hypothetical protein
VTGTTNVGGLVGGINRADYYPDYFWDVNTSSQNISAGGTGKTTEQMQKAAMYIRWGYCEIWKIDDSNDYPRLLWQSGPGEPIVHPGQLFAGGSGSAKDPYLIETSEQLVNISLTYYAWDKYFKLIADIDMNDFNCAEMGMIGVASFAFRGVFDGNRNTISNLHICSDAYAKVGLFGQLEGYDSAVVNLGLISPNIDTNTSREVGSLAGKLNRTTISGCYCRGGNVSGYGRVGGLVGYNFLGTVLDSYAQTNVSASGGFDTGGLVGRLNSGNMTRTYSTGSVSAGGSPGGLLGKNFYGRVYDSFWDTQTSDCNVSDGGTGLTTVEMQTENTFTDAGWDFIGEKTNGYDNIWRMCQDEVDYPKLTWEFTSYGDLTCPDGVDFNDYSILADQWLLEKLDADMTNDGRVNLRDFAAWANQWQGDYTLLKELTQSWLAHSAGIADIAPAGGDDFVDWQDLAILTENWLGEK